MLEQFENWFHIITFALFPVFPEELANFRETLIANFPSRRHLALRAASHSPKRWFMSRPVRSPYPCQVSTKKTFYSLSFNGLFGWHSALYFLKLNKINRISSHCGLLTTGKESSRMRILCQGQGSESIAHAQRIGLSVADVIGFLTSWLATCVYDVFVTMLVANVISWTVTFFANETTKTWYCPWTMVAYWSYPANYKVNNQ